MCTHPFFNYSHRNSGTLPMLGHKVLTLYSGTKWHLGTYTSASERNTILCRCLVISARAPSVNTAIMNRLQNINVGNNQTKTQSGKEKRTWRVSFTANFPFKVLRSRLNFEISCQLKQGSSKISLETKCRSLALNFRCISLAQQCISLRLRMPAQKKKKKAAHAY